MFFSDVSFKEYPCYETESEGSRHVNRFVLVDNPPFFASTFEEVLKEKVKAYSKKYNGSETIYFIKERNIDFLTKYLWGDGEYYYNCEAKISDEDFLASAFYKKNSTKYSLEFYKGDLYHY